MFYKKFIALLVSLALTLCAVFISGQILFAKANTVDAHDQYFIEFVREDTGAQSIEYSCTQLYDAQLNANGRQYVFEADGVQGYALTAVVQIGNEYFYEVEELFYNKPAPFVNYQGLPVYITFNTYLDNVDGIFYDLSNDRAVVSQEVLAQLELKGFGYKGNPSGEYVVWYDTINYSSKTTDQYTFPHEAPNFYGSSNGSCCANNAGAVVIAYYDRFYQNLIPDYDPCIIFLGQTFYRGASAEIADLLETMRVYMAVEGITQGTTFTGFQNGMERYVEEKGYTYSTTSVMSWGELDYEDYKTTVEQEIPVGLFLNGFTMCGVEEGTNQDIVDNSTYTATHVEVGIGYKTVTYYNSNGSVITTRKYLKVVSGITGYGIGYLNISSNAGGEIVNTIAIDIY